VHQKFSLPTELPHPDFLAELIGERAAMLLRRRRNGYEPAQNSSEQRGVETLGRRETPLHLGDGDLVLGRRAEQRQTTGHRAEQVRLRYRSATHRPVFLRLLHADCMPSDNVLRNLVADHFSSPSRALDRVCVCLCVNDNCQTTRPLKKDT